MTDSVSVRPLKLVPAFLVLGLVAAACGWGSDLLSKAELVSRGDVECARENATVDPLVGEIFAGEAPDMKKAAANLPAISAALRKRIDAFRALEPVENERRSIAAIISDLERLFQAFLPRVTAAAQAGDVDAFGEALQETEPAAASVDRAQRDYGFKVCGAEQAEGDEDATETPTAASVPKGSPVVTVTDLKFRPAELTIRAGQAVVWAFADGVIPHNVKGSALKSPDTTEGRWAHVFNEAGTFDYVCSIHPFMKGTIRIR